MHILDYLVYLGQCCSHIIGKTSYDQPPSARHTLEMQPGHYSYAKHSCSTLRPCQTL